jgi:hypothetical protein
MTTQYVSDVPFSYEQEFLKANPQYLQILEDIKRSLSGSDGLVADTISGAPALSTDYSEDGSFVIRFRVDTDSYMTYVLKPVLYQSVHSVQKTD